MTDISRKETNKKQTRLGKKVLVVVVVGVCVLAIGYVLFGLGQRGGESENIEMTSHTVSREDLIVSFTESGDIKALESTDIACKVEGRTTIISIVDEGYIVTEEDIANSKILVELDSSKIEQKLNQQRVKVSNARASYTEAEESLQIQIKQNESDIQAGQMDVRFALLDIQKYLGEQLAVGAVNDVTIRDGTGNYAGLLVNQGLGGEALQMLKGLSSDIELAQSRLERAYDHLGGTQKLFDKGYVAETELTADKLEKQSLDAQLEKAQIALKLFRLYEFPKQTQSLLSGYDEAMRELDRINARARSKLSQTTARRDNKKSTLELEEKELVKLEEQFKACTIRATVAGQIVYGSSLLDRWRRRNEAIRVGSDVRERQIIISTPDTSRMKVDVKVHETWIGKIRQGQNSKITISAFPDKSFSGHVIQKSPMADPEDWLNPDLKVYNTQVSIEGAHDYIKTGMSAKVELIVEHLKDVLTVPIQCVSTEEGQKYCYVLNSGKAERRKVEAGAFNADFVEIKSGLQEGDKVALNIPRMEKAAKSRRSDKSLD